MNISVLLPIIFGINRIFAAFNGTAFLPEHHLSDNTQGSAQALDGNIVVVSIFADDSNTSWDLENDEADYERYCLAYSNMNIAADWTQQQCKNYGRDVNYIWDWTEHEDLFYWAAFDDDFPATIETGMSETYSWAFIDENIDSDALLNEYDAQSILYVMYFDTPIDNPVSTCTRNWYEGMEYPYEVCYMFMGDNGYDLNPAIFAHEMLHTFGAPDLYMPDPEFGIHEQLVESLERSHSNDIMRICGDPYTGEMYYDRIVNEITHITARYIDL